MQVNVYQDPTTGTNREGKEREGNDKMDLDDIIASLAGIKRNIKELEFDIRNIKYEHILKTTRDYSKPLYLNPKYNQDTTSCPTCGRSFKAGSDADMRVNGAIKE